MPWWVRVYINTQTPNVAQRYLRFVFSFLFYFYFISNKANWILSLFFLSFSVQPLLFIYLFIIYFFSYFGFCFFFSILHIFGCFFGFVFHSFYSFFFWVFLFDRDIKVNLSQLHFLFFHFFTLNQTPKWKIKIFSNPYFFFFLSSFYFPIPYIFTPEIKRYFLFIYNIFHFLLWFLFFFSILHIFFFFF